ncbi:DUF2889 domain-containing protein [Sphingomonas sp. R86520]|uniref:DUF2889 domain-containing protein n=1 Tax=Sphingomonas sp. R86520 TaxID=3093859 RepID=UPI0036D2B096
MTPAFHRHVLITPGESAVRTWVEDDYHHMGVTLHHDGATIRGVEAEILRAPWSTCPGAVAQLEATFAGVALGAVATRGEKTINCTHLHDMAVIAAFHAHDATPTRYTIVVSDAVDGIRVAEIARDGIHVLRLVEQSGLIVEPAAALKGTLFQLGGWMALLEPAEREAARLLRWAAIIAHGRAIPMDRQSDATRMPATCFTFQEGRKQRAVRIGRIVDFSAGDTLPSTK